MEFKALFEKYRNGTATEAERTAVESEMEKFHLLMEQELEAEPPAELPEPSVPEMERVKKAARRRTGRIVLASVLLACLLVVGSSQLYSRALVPWLNENYYYRPELWDEAEYGYTDLHVVSAAFTELTTPFYITSDVSWENTGLGEYDLSIYQWGWGDKSDRWLEGSIDKGIFQMPDDYFRETAAANLFVRASAPFYPDDGDAKMLSNAREKLRELPDYMRLTLAISLDTDMSMEDFAALKEANPELGFLWVGVRASERDTQTYPLLGFEPTGSGPLYEAVNESYPCYELHGTEKNGVAYTQHYISLLRLMADKSELVSAICGDRYHSYARVFELALDYAETEGVYTYGFYVSGSPEDLLPLLELESVCKVGIEDLELRVSLYD